MTRGPGVRGRRPLAVLAGAVVLSMITGVGLAFGASPAARAAYRTPLVAGLPCTITARACVDLESQKAWLIDKGKVVRGPVPIASGGNGEETPIGHSLRVYRKEKDHKSKESRLPNGQPAPMPYSVFFEDGGIAFHGGSPNRSSAGCIHLNPADAQAWFTFLKVGDQVQVVKGSEEMAARSGKPAPTKDSDESDDDSDDDGSDHDSDD